MPLVADTEELTLIELPQPQTGGPTGGGPEDPGWDDRGGGDGDEDPDGSGYMPDLGIFGMRLMLVSITTLFVAIGLVYLALASSAKHWPPVRIPRLLWLSTAVILVSSWTLHIARRHLLGGKPRGYSRWMGVTVLLGLAFLTLQFLSLRQLIAQGFYLKGNPHSLMFFVITGAHGIHLFAGLLMLFFLLTRAMFAPATIRTDFRRQRARNSVAALYWHWLDGLWVVMFVLLVARSS